MYRVKKEEIEDKTVLSESELIEQQFKDNRWKDKILTRSVQALNQIQKQLIKVA